MVYLERIRGKNRLFKLDLETKEKKRVTHGNVREATVEFIFFFKQETAYEVSA
mgnify:CR=1 FL=1